MRDITHGGGPQAEPPLLYQLSAGGSALIPSPPLYPESPFGTSVLSTMGTPNDQAVLQAIFNPDTPFGNVFGFDLGEEAEKEEADEGEHLTLVCDTPHRLAHCPYPLPMVREK